MVALCAVGDISVLYHEQPELAFANITDTIKAADIAFCQLEETLSERGCVNLLSRSSVCGHPRVASALKSVGFDIVSFASNHCLDSGTEAFLDTIDVLTRNGLKVIGAGKDIQQARQPAIIECDDLRIAFLGYNSILQKRVWADHNKPGCAPLRVFTVYEPIEYDQPGQPSRAYTFAHPADLEAMKADITKARDLADVVIVSFHWGLHLVRALLAGYQRDIGHAAIDCGADLIIGHHPHLLKGIEVYKGKVIFYSLGNFYMESRITKAYPQISPGTKELMETYGWEIEPEWGKIYPYPVDSRKTVIAKAVISSGKVERVSFLPSIIDKRAMPRILSPKDQDFYEVLKYIEAISHSQGLETSFDIDGEEVVVLT